MNSPADHASLSIAEQARRLGVSDRYHGFWGKEGGPYLDQIRYRPIPDDTVKTQSLIGAEIEVMDYVAPRDVAMLKGNSNVVEVDVPSLPLRECHQLAYDWARATLPLGAPR